MFIEVTLSGDPTMLSMLNVRHIVQVTPVQVARLALPPGAPAVKTEPLHTDISLSHGQNMRVQGSYDEVCAKIQEAVAAAGGAQHRPAQVP